MPNLIDETFLHELFNISYEEIKNLAIYQYDIETKKPNDANLLYSDRLSGSSKTEYLFNYLSSNTRKDIDRRAKGPIEIGFLSNKRKILKNKKVFEEYSLKDTSLCGSELLTSGLSIYYDLLILVACLFDINRFPDDWDKYYNEHRFDTSIKYKELLFDYLVFTKKSRLRRKIHREYYISYTSHSIVRELLKNEENKRLYSYDCFVYLFEKIYSIECYLSQNDPEWENAYLFSIYNVLYYCAGYLIKRDDYNNAFLYVSWAIRTDSFYLLTKSFNRLGYCAIQMNKYQLAYDILFSWINSKLIKSLKLSCGLDDSSFNKINRLLKNGRTQLTKEQENDWSRSINCNFSYVCRVLLDLISSEQERAKVVLLAKYTMDKAISRDHNNKDLYYYKGRFCSKINEYKEAIDCYSKAISSDSKQVDKTSILRFKTRACQNRLYGKQKSTFDAAARDFIMSYQALLDENTNSYEIINGRDLYVLLSKCDRLSPEKKDLKYKLFDIDNTITEILTYLRRTPKLISNFDSHYSLLSNSVKKELSIIKTRTRALEQLRKEDNKEIAYYTTLGILKYLFSDVVIGQNSHQRGENGKEDKENKDDKCFNINSLTMMHARYMNDPEEGLVLFKYLREYFTSTPEKLRDMLYDQKHVFLKSFTGLVDQLNMWTMYGSDRNSNSDCNGCCVCLAPESFAPGSSYKDKMDNKTWKHFDDDYGLYDVAYIDGDKIIVNGGESKYLEDRFAQLKTQLATIHKTVKKATDNDKQIIMDCLVRLLEKLVFLVKDVSYSQEAESRIVLSRDINDRFDIKETEQDEDNPQDPRRLFINPPFQVYVKKIILGPKLENAEFWIPHLQYELSKMHDKWLYGDEQDYNPNVRLSEINIR